MAKPKREEFETLFLPTTFDNRTDWADVFEGVVYKDPMLWLIRGHGGDCEILNELVSIIDKFEPPLSVQVIGNCYSAHSELVTYLIQYLKRMKRIDKFTIAPNAFLAFHKPAIEMDSLAGTRDLNEAVAIANAILDKEYNNQILYTSHFLTSEELKRIQAGNMVIINDLMVKDRI